MTDKQRALFIEINSKTANLNSTVGELFGLMVNILTPVDSVMEVNIVRLGGAVTAAITDLATLHNDLILETEHPGLLDG